MKSNRRINKNIHLEQPSSNQEYIVEPKEI